MERELLEAILVNQRTMLEALSELLQPNPGGFQSSRGAWLSILLLERKQTTDALLNKYRKET